MADKTAKEHLYEKQYDGGLVAIYCEHCKKQLDPTKAVWLELSCKTGEWTIEGKPHPPEESQGCFSFGPDCAKRVLAGKITNFDF